MIRGMKLFVGSFQLLLLVVLLTLAPEFSVVGCFVFVLTAESTAVFSFSGFSGVVVLNIFMEETLVKGGLAGKFLVSISSFKKPWNPVIFKLAAALSEFSRLIGSFSVLKFVKLSRESSFKLMSSSLALGFFNILACMNNRNYGILLFLLYSSALLYYTIWTCIIVSLKFLFIF